MIDKTLRKKKERKTTKFLITQIESNYCVEMCCPADDAVFLLFEVNLWKTL